MSKVLSNPLIYDIVPKTTNIQVVKSITHFASGLIESLEDVKNPSFVANMIF